jgi:hypothetical protein
MDELTKRRFDLLHATGYLKTYGDMAMNMNMTGAFWWSVGLSRQVVRRALPSVQNNLGCVSGGPTPLRIPGSSKMSLRGDS